MADNKETEETPKLIIEKDETFLDDIALYSAQMLPVLAMATFKEIWAPALFGLNDDVQKQALLGWEANVAMGRNKPVYLLDEMGRRRWCFPPLAGEVTTGFTGSETSFYAKTTEARIHQERLKSSGTRIMDRFIDNLDIETVDQHYWAKQLHAIRMECGIPYRGEESIEKPAETKNEDLTENEDDYDF